MVFTFDGKVQLAKFLAGESVDPPTYVAFGTSSDSPNEFDTSLAGEQARVSVNTATRSKNIATISGTLGFLEGNGTTLKELGSFNAATDGTMTNRITWTGTDKDNTIQIQAQISFKVK